MKNFALLIAFLLTGTLFAQSPMRMSYQSVIRNASSQLITNHQVGTKISILQGTVNGTVVYAETHVGNTNGNGLLTLEIGGGSPSSGDFSTINWSDGPYFIKTETDPTGGSNYSITGVSQLMSVPYALHAQTAQSLSGGIQENDPVFSAAPAAQLQLSDLSNWDQAYSWGNHALAGYLTEEQDASATNEIQLLSIRNDTIFLTEGGFVKLPAGFDGSYNSLTGKPTDVSAFANDAGYLTQEEDASATNEIQLLSIRNDTIFLTEGGSIKLPNQVASAIIQNDSLYIYYTHGTRINAGYVGNGSPGSALPAISATTATNIRYASITASAEVLNAGGEYIMSRGICLSTDPAPGLGDMTYPAGNGMGSFSTTIDNLEPNTIYHARAYATNVIGTAYGNETTFQTLPVTLPALTTNPVFNISHTTAQSGGNITDDGGTPILERGICWSTHAAPTTTDPTDPQGTNTGSFNALMSGLNPNTLYYVRAYATNDQGTAYGDELSFTTSALSLASITTTTVSAVSYTSAMSGGNVTADNGSPVTSRGLCWSTTPSPTTSDGQYTEAGGTGSFTASITGLSPSTTYYTRAFAINEAGTVYGNEYSFTTLSLSAPALTTKTISGISSNLAGSGGNISTDGGSAITAKGICWSLNPSPSLSDQFTTNGTGSDSYNSLMTGLNPLTTYYVRAYATNSLGTSYGNELSFTTTDLVFPGPSVPVVGTSTSLIQSSTTAQSGGYISSDGGSEVTERGICWSLAPEPSLADNYTIDGSGLGYYSSTITGLSGCGTVYYVRAYATNSTGTGYGNQNTVSTGLPATVVIDGITNIGYYSAEVNVSIPDNGGCDITAKGVCWSYNPNPTIGNQHTSDGTGDAPFTASITGLYANRTYYVRPYATNNTGTSYGPQEVFTSATPTTAYIGQHYAGGIVFYVDESGEHGLVCTENDLGSYAWGCNGTLISGTGTAVGTGMLNTAAILAGCSTAGIAARACDDLVLNGYSDWYLPSRDEVSLMWTNLYAQGLGNFYQFNQYWSSSEYNASYAWYTSFYNGSSWYNDKNYAQKVRAVRSF